MLGMLLRALSTDSKPRPPVGQAASLGAAVAHYQGAPVRDEALCTRCRRCQEVCPTHALDSWDSCDLAKCSTCRLCGGACEAGAISYAADFELAQLGGGALVRPMAKSRNTLGSGPGPQGEGLALSAEIRRTLGRSLHIRHVDSGSCNACDWEMTALTNSVHDLQRFGMDFVASPRHADLLMVTGSASAHLVDALLSAHRCMAEPRLVMALGSCACGGGMSSGGYANCGGVDKVVPVDIYVPGCPPRPQAIIYALLGMLGRLPTQQRSRDDSGV